MFRCTSVACVLLLVAVLASNLRPADNPLKDAQVLEEAMQQAIKSAEPSIACILVSRDEKAYKEYGQVLSAEDPGRLGDFRPDGEREKFERMRKLDLADPEYVPEAYGSGVGISARDRLILTNYHVIRDAVKIYVRLGGEEKGSYANIFAADPRSDLAVLQLIDPKIAVKEIKTGDGSNLKKGQFVIALAHPFAVGFRDGSPSASWGIISNIRRPVVTGLKEAERSKVTLAQFGRLIQIDARLNLGCSGGALVNLKGEMVGITNSMAALTGIETPGGFALPLDDSIRSIVEVLKRGEEVEYGFLGVSMRRDGKRGEAYEIESVIANSPAAVAGLKPQLYVVSVNGARIHDANELFFNIAIAIAGSDVKIEVASDINGPTEVRSVTLVKSYVSGKVIAANRPDAKKYGGLRVDYTSVLMQQMSERRTWGSGPIPSGVAIREVLDKSPAAAALLQPDKVITHVNGEPVDLPKKFYAEMDKARKAGKSVELIVTNVGDQPYKVKLDLP